MINGQFDNAQFAYDVLKAREASGLTLRQLSTLIGVSRTILHRAERSGTLELESIIKICNWLNKPVQHYLKPKTHERN